MSDHIDAHCAWLRAGRRAHRTIDEREQWLRRADAHLPWGVVEADRSELTQYLGQPGWAPATGNKVFYHLNAFYTWGLHTNTFADNPMHGMIRPAAPKGEPRPLSDEDLEQLLATAREPHLTLAILGAGAGLRVSESCTLRREDVTEDSVWVRDGKGGYSAEAPALPGLYEHVRGLPRGRVVEHVGGVADGRTMSMRASAYITRTLGMPGVCLHRCRHTYARLLREGGADLAVISEALRHRHLSSTQVYFRASKAECRLAVRTLRLPTPGPCRNLKP